MLAGTDLPSSSRALVLVGSAAPEKHPCRPIQRVASFVTQLIANAARLRDGLGAVLPRLGAVGR